MKLNPRGIHKIIDDQIQKWEKLRTMPSAQEEAPLAITISREAGSGGKIIAERLAKRLGYDLFHREIIQRIVEDASVSERLVETLDERALNILDEWVSTLVNERHLWPDQYLKVLMKVIGTIGKHGRAVIVGRGSNFILPKKEQFRVRVVAPLEVRVKNVAREFGASVEEARRRVMKTDADREAFAKKYFHADIKDPANYDMVVNTGTLSINSAVSAILGALGVLE